MFSGDIEMCPWEEMGQNIPFHLILLKNVMTFFCITIGKVLLISIFFFINCH